MNKKNSLNILFICVFCLCISFTKNNLQNSYFDYYTSKLNLLNQAQNTLLTHIKNNNLASQKDKELLKQYINEARLILKNCDFWLRYLEPVSYKKINGPLPVEWETEVFEKFEKPYKRQGAGLTLAYLYLEEETVIKDTLLNLITRSVNVMPVYNADSITKHLTNYHHFFLCNRLFLLNLATIYTTGFECPNTDAIIPELNEMLNGTKEIYAAYNQNFTETPLPANYIELYANTINYVAQQPKNYEDFDHFTFIKNYINPLFAINQQLINNYKVVSKSYIDYSLNKTATSIFNKDLYDGQNPKGIFLRVKDEKVLDEIEKIGKLLFYDPILSTNNMRSCASCHKPTQFFTDTATATSLALDGKTYLPRNSPTLINAQYNHLLMLDGKHLTLQDQTKGVITNNIELGSAEEDVMKKILSCGEYKDAFNQFLKYTPQEKKITLEHVCSAITMYYSKFSNYYAPFDDAMNKNKALDENAKKGFNVFMSKAQCATCHFAPQFNGVKPPYVGSEFEVLGVPADLSYSKLSKDKGRHDINPATETLNAFRTGTVRNSDKTKPYMHNGVFKTINEVIDFYDAGGGVGKGLKVNNQTLSSDSLHLTQQERNYLTAFIKSLNEDVKFEALPEKLPKSKIKKLNLRKVSGEY
jgi:cytochrome c peroxidase